MGRAFGRCLQMGREIRAPSAPFDSRRSAPLRSAVGVTASAVVPTVPTARAAPAEGTSAATAVATTKRAATEGTASASAA